MASITIKYVGALKVVSLDIKRVNVFMGPQASGKSTIAKIISQALWAEKHFLTMGEEYDFYQGLLDFHNMDKNYFSNPKAEIIYESPWCVIRMKYEEGKRTPKTVYEKRKNKKLYHNAKIEYIPAERNFVASIENISKYTGIRNNTTHFLYDWYTAKSSYQRKKSFDVALPDLSFSYRYKESEERDIIRVADNEVTLQAGSSGQQSLLPLLLVAEEVLVSTYNTQRIFSPAEIAHLKKKAPDLASVIDDVLAEMGKRARTKQIEKSLQGLWQKIGYQADYGCTHLVVEEPEQNLYPSTQRGLLNHLVAYLSKDTEHQHTLTLTTHSPYILYALNNCMLAGLVEQENPDAIEKIPTTTRINPADVGLWLLNDGEIISLQKSDTLLLTQDFFNREFQKNHEEMFQLLKLLHNENLSTADTSK